MKNFHQGFIGIVVGIIVALVVGGAVTYVAISNKNDRQGEMNTETENENSNTSASTNTSSNCLTITSPQKNATVHFPLTVTGTIQWGCWGIFEANAGGVSVRQNGNWIGGAQGGLPVQGKGGGSSYERSSYPVTFNVTVTATGIVHTGPAELVFVEDDTCGDAPECPADRAPIVYPITIGVPAGLPDHFSISAAGSLVDESDMSGHFPPAALGEDTMTVKAYFSNANLLSANPENYGHSQYDHCLAVYPVTRTIPETSGVGKAALEELFRGPTQAEMNAGYGTAWGNGITVKSLIIQNGVAYLDLNKLEGVGGSCGTNTMVAQINQTLKQFPTVSSVSLTINGYAPDWESMI